MNQLSLQGLIYNASLLISLGVICNILPLWRKNYTVLVGIVTGLILGLIGIFLMMSPWHFSAGVIFDSRSILLSVGGLYFGALPAAVAVLITVLFRLSLGGAGEWMGVGVILSSASIGVAWHYIRRNRMQGFIFSSWELLLFGIVVNFIMLLWMKLLPGPLSTKALADMALPVMIIFPVATVILGKLLGGQYAKIIVEENLRREKDLSQRYLDVAAVMIVALNAKGEVTLINKKGYEILGYEEKDIIGKNWFDHFIPSRIAKETLGTFHRLISGDIAPLEYFENPVLTKEGEERLVAWHNSFVKNAAGKIIGIISSGEDITERRLNAKEKEDLEAKLRQAYKMEAIGTLAGGIAHDFNNMLAIILGNAELALEDAPQDHPVRDTIKQVLSASNRAKDLVRQILAFSRREKQEMIPLKPQVMIKETLRFLRSTTPSTVSIVQDIREECGTIIADPTQLHQLLINLVTNAVHATNEKGEIKISLRQVHLNTGELDHIGRLYPGPYVKLSVADNGHGMDEITIGRIFDPFFTTKGVGEGTGMGLSVVHGIVEAHQGMIKVHSKKGEGSVFDIFFPIVDKIEITTDISSEHLPTGTERILFVDDEEGLAILGSRLLENQGYIVKMENSSIKALETFKAGHKVFDLVITDQAMPEMAGTELSQEILKIKPDMPIILCTGYSSKLSSKEDVAALGIRELMFKPYDKNQLAETVRKVLDENQQTGQAQQLPPA